MNLTSILALFISGVALLLVSSRLLVEVSKQLAQKWKLSPLFVSLVLVSLGTNLPELTILISSLINNDPGLAMGNIIGSNISNITLIFGVGTLLHSPKIGTVKTQKNNLLLIALTILFITMEILPIANLIKGIVLLIFLIGFLIYEYSLAKNGRLYEDKNLFEKIEDSIDDTKEKVFNQNGSILISVLAIIGAVLGLGIGSNLIVTSVEYLSVLLNISTSIIGITLVATTTSLPELITIIIAGAKREDKIVIGTLIGSNIYNLAMFIPIIKFSPYQTLLKSSSLIYLLFSTFFFAYIIISAKGKRVPKIYGVMSIIIFIFFLVNSFS